MKKQLHVNVVVETPHDDVITPTSINFEDIVSYKSCIHELGFKGRTLIRTSSAPGTYIVTETYDQVRKMMEDLRVEDIRPCYRIKIGYQVHYVPKNEVSHIAIDEENSNTTLILKSGDKIRTGQTMIELRESSIEIPF